MHVYKHHIPCTAWSSGLGAHVPRIFHKLKQIKEKATSARSCNVPQWCWQKAWCFLQGWSSGEGIGTRIIQGYRIHSWSLLSCLSSHSPWLCPADWRRCPLKAPGLSGRPWIAARGLQARCCVYSVGLQRTKMAVEIWFFPSLHSNLSSCSWNWNSAELPYPRAQKGVWGYNHVGHLWFGR